jgi:hypothetical protein
MWIKPDYNGTLEDLIEEVKFALEQFEKDKANGTAIPIDDSDKTQWL